MYRSGHNENDSKSFGRTNAARGFESHRLRQIAKKALYYGLFLIYTPNNIPQKEKNSCLNNKKITFSNTTYDVVREKTY